MSLSGDNSRKIGLAIILVGLMMVIIGFGKYFEDRLKIATLTQSRMANLIEYEMMDGYVKYQLPDDWLTTSVDEQSQESGAITEFISIDDDIYGYIELTDNQGGFQESVDVFKEDIKNMGITDLSSTRIEVNGTEAEAVKYTFKYNDKSIKKTYEYYIPNGEDILRVSITMNNSKVKENTELVLENIIKTVKFTDINDK